MIVTQVLRHVTLEWIILRYCKKKSRENVLKRRFYRRFLRNPNERLTCRRNEPKFAPLLFFAIAASENMFIGRAVGPGQTVESREASERAERVNQLWPVANSRKQDDR